VASADCCLICDEDMRHRLGTILLVIGVGMLVWAATVYLWKDPFTTAYTAYEQRRLESTLEQQFETWRPTRRPVSRPGKPTRPLRDDVTREARRYRLASHRGNPLARLKIPRLGLDAVVVNGTSSGDLRRGPGRHLDTFMPGERQLVYVAGHRTTYGAPFSSIDRLRPGDKISVELPYASIDYEVTRHRIVDDNDLSVLESNGREELVLQACHPRFFASQRYLVYARPVAVTARG
jgi:sortase A